MDSDMPSIAADSFTAIIVGASISGLVLANSLSRQGIQCTILESRADPLSNAGAALTIVPNGSRILDQLDLLEDAEKVSAPFHLHQTWLESGRSLRCVNVGHFPSRFGYDFFVIERQALLSVLLRHVSPSTIKLGRKVVRIDSTPSGVCVRCADGSLYNAHLVVGADGVHGVTHSEMYRNMAIGGILPKPQTRPTASFSGFFGTSAPVRGMKSGIANRTYGHHFSFIVIVGKGDRVHWYLAIRRKTLEKIPRYEQKDIDRSIQPYLTVKVADGIYFDDVYRNRITCCHLPLEEGLQQRWAWGRFACIGDAVHKMTPNIAQGANCAMETAASLANHLSQVDRHTDLKLEEWYKPRRDVARFFYLSSKCLVRVEASSWWLGRWLGRYIGLVHGPFVMDTLAGISPCSELLAYLPVPRRAARPILVVRFVVLAIVVALLQYLLPVL